LLVFVISCLFLSVFFFFFSSRRRHTRWPRDWSSDVCSSDLRMVRQFQGLADTRQHGAIDLKRPQVVVEVVRHVEIVTLRTERDALWQAPHLDLAHAGHLFAVNG